MIWKQFFKQFNFTVNHKSSGKMESVRMVGVAEENQEDFLGIQYQANGEVQVSMEAEVSHSHLLVKRSRRRNEACTETEKDEMRKLKRRGVSACNVFLVLEQDTRVYQRAVLVSEIHKRSLSFSRLVSDAGLLQGRRLTRACERYMILST